MARCALKWCDSQHVFCATTKPLGDSPPGRFVLVGGPRPYLNVHSDQVPASFYHMSGQQQLRRLARAILRTVKAPKPRKRKP